jgi:hypothetical protein
VGRQYEGHSKSYWLEALNSTDDQARAQAIHMIGTMDDDADDVIPRLTEALRTDSFWIARNEAALALMKLAPRSRSAVPELAVALKDEQPLVRVNAALALFKMKEEARPAIPALLDALKDKTNETNARAYAFTIQEISAKALGRATAGTKEAVPVLMALLKDAKTPMLRGAVLDALGEVGPEARDALPQVRAMTKDKVKFVCQAAEAALQKIETK